MAAPTPTPKSLPLQNISIAITRAEHQAAQQRTMLEALGAMVYQYPCIKIVPPRDLAKLDDALTLASNGVFDWLIFTSANTVQAIAERMEALSLLPKSLTDIKIAAVGPKTAAAVQNLLDLTSEHIPEEFTAEALAQSLTLDGGEQIFLPQSALAKRTLLETLRKTGAAVTHVDAYRTVIAQTGDPVPALLWEGQIDAITFTSESTVRFFAKRLDFEQGTLAMLDDVCVACIGPVTAAAAQALGIGVQVLPDDHTLEGLHAGLVDYFASGARLGFGTNVS